MSNSIVIESFQWGLANDRNIGQKWAFWNSKNIEFRRNSAYIELSKWVSTAFTVSSIPIAITFWWSQSSIYTDLVVFTGYWVYTSAGQQSLTSWIINVWEANSVKYLVTSTQIYSYTNPSTNTLLDTFNATTEHRPMIDWFGDLIIGNGNNIARINEWTSVLVDYTAWATNWTIGGLDGKIYALTMIGTNIYVWCNNGTNTNLYIWDWSSANPSQVIKYSDKPVMNVALLGNMHYWWSSKSTNSIKEVLIGESYSPQTYVKSDYTKYPLSTNYDDEKNRMAIYVDNNTYLNSIETMGDIVYFPWYGWIFWFGRYFPWQPFAFAKEYSFTGTHVTAMASWWLTWSGRDAWWMLAFSCRNWSTYDINIINLWQEWETPWVFYRSSWEVETMEFVAPVFADGEANKKIVVAFDLPHSSTSIKVYYKMDRATSYTELDTINTTKYGTGYSVAELQLVWQWRTIQFKFELITSNTSYTPKLYTWITNISDTVWKK